MLNCDDKNIQWFKEARFGLFIHWGLYAATEGTWKGKEIPGIVEWIAAKEKIPNKEYEKLAERMTCENFDEKKLARLAKNAGMKYCVFTAKHHEGFAMFDTDYDDYSIVKRTPYGKDAAGKIAEAMRSEGIMPCFYYSQAIDFHEKNAMGNTWDNYADEKDRDFLSYINGKCKYQLRELLTNYGEIGLIWMDVPKGITEETAADIKSYVKKYQPNCLVSGRIGGTPEMGDYGCLGDNQIPAGKLDGCWETASTMNDTWGYKRNDHNFKTPKDIIELLCGLISNGTNLLLNIGPDAKGNIPAESVHILQELAGWTSINGEVIHGTEASPFVSEFTFGGCCRKKNILYFFLNDETSSISVMGIRNKIMSAEILGKRSIDFEQKDGCFTAMLSPTDFGEYVTVLKVITDGNPIVDDGLYAQERDSIILPAHCCTIEKNDGIKANEIIVNDAAIDAERFNLLCENEISISVSGVVEKWYSEKDHISWTFESGISGEYQIILYTMSQKYTPWVGGHSVYFECGKTTGNAELKADVITKGANKKYFDETGSVIGTASIKKGKNVFRLFAKKINKNDSAGFNVSKVILKRVM